MLYILEGAIVPPLFA